MADVVVLGPDGTPILVPEAAAGEVAPAGGHVMSRAEERTTRHELELRDKFAGAEGYIAPELAGAARGLTFGTSDEALLSAAEALGGHDAREALRQRLAGYQDYNPIASEGGEMIGMGVGALAGNEAGLIGRGGRAVEGLVTRGLGEGAFARVAGKVASSALSGAGENALYGAGKAASEAAIQDQPLTGEKLVAGASHGALFGGVAGGVLGLAGGVGSEILSGMRAPHGGSAIARKVGEAAPRGSIADQLEKGADVKTIKALGGSAGDLRKLEANVPGGFRRVAQDIRGDVEASTGKSIGLHDRESLHEYATKRVDELGEKLGTMLEKLDSSGTAIAPSPKAFIAQARKELIEPNLIMKHGLTANDSSFSVMPGQEKSVEAVEKWIGRIDGAFSERAPTFKEWQKIRVGLDKELKFESAQVSPAVEALRKLRGIMEGELESSGEKAAQSVGGNFASEYQATKSLYQSVKKASELTERGVSRELANNSLGLRATMAALTGHAAGGPVAGALMGAAGKVIQDRGDMMAADLLSRSAALLGTQRIAGRVTSQMQQGIRKLIPQKAGTEAISDMFGPPARAAAAPLGVRRSKDIRSDYRQMSEAIASATANPQATTERVSKSLGALGDHAPATAAAAINTTLQGLNYLAANLPSSRRDPYSLQPQFQPRNRASDAEIAQFMRKAEAVDDPLIVLREAKTNTLTRDHVDAVKAVYPNLYKEMQGQTMQSLMYAKTELPYDKRIQLGILLDIPTDKTLAPDFLREIQATYSSVEKAGAEIPPSISDAPQLAGPAQTATQQAVGRAA